MGRKKDETIKLNGQTIKSKIETLLYTVPYCSLYSISMLGKNANSIRKKKHMMANSDHTVQTIRRKNGRLTAITSTEKLREQYRSKNLETILQDRQYKNEQIENMKIRSEIAATIIAKGGTICNTVEEIKSINTSCLNYIDIAHIRLLINNVQDKELNNKGISTLKGYCINEGNFYSIYEIKRNSSYFYYNKESEDSMLRKIRQKSIEYNQQTFKFPDLVKNINPSIVVCMQSQKEDDNFLARYCNYRPEYNTKEKNKGAINSLKGTDSEITIIPWNLKRSSDFLHCALSPSYSKKINETKDTLEINFNSNNICKGNNSNYLIFMPLLKLKELYKIVKYIETEIQLYALSNITIGCITYKENMESLKPVFNQLKSRMIKQVSKENENYTLTISLRLIDNELPSLEI